jgi:hypothetical protein
MYNYIFLLAISSNLLANDSLSLLTTSFKDTISYCHPLRYNKSFNSEKNVLTQSIFNATGNENYSPVRKRIEAGYWSDKLAIVPYREYLATGNQDNLSRLAAQLLTESFNLAGKSAEETSQIITDAMKGGASVYGHISFSPVELVSGRIVAGLSSSISFTCDLPEAPFLLLFSEKNGLRTGSDLPMTHLGLKACITTDIESHYAKQISVDKSILMLNKMTCGVVECDNAFIINGMTVSLGNAMLDMTTTNGGIHLNSDGNELYADAHFRLRGSGINLRSDNILNVTKEKGFPVSGIGLGLNSSLLITGEHTILAVGFKKLGPMVWSNMKEAEISLKTANISVEELFKKNYQLFNSDNGGQVTGVDTGEIMHNISSEVCWLPLSVNIFYEYRFFIQAKNEGHWIIPEYVVPSISYNQNLTTWPGLIAGPGLTIGCGAGFIKGILPLSAGWSFGYGKNVTSLLSAGLNVKKINFQIGYEATGTPYWYPKRGCTVYLQIVSGWGRGNFNKTDTPL